MLLTRQNTQWRGMRRWLAVAVAAIIAATLLSPARPALLLVGLSGLALGGAGVELRFALQHDSSTAFDHSRGLRRIAAALLVVGATISAAGWTIFFHRGAP
jgi:hypothetical protein